MNLQKSDLDFHEFFHSASFNFLNSNLVHAILEKQGRSAILVRIIEHKIFAAKIIKVTKVEILLTNPNV